MSKEQTISEATEGVLDMLRDIEDAFPLESSLRKTVFTARRQLQAAQDDYLKQGDRVKVTTKFEIKCTECSAVQMREEDYYLHLRQKHQYSDEDAASKANEPRNNYDQGLQQLNELLAEYTETLLENV